MINNQRQSVKQAPTMPSKQDEIAFTKMLNNFEAAIENDLNHRSSEVAKKWEFDFSME